MNCFIWDNHLECRTLSSKTLPKGKSVSNPNSLTQYHCDLGHITSGGLFLSLKPGLIIDNLSLIKSLQILNEIIVVPILFKRHIQKYNHHYYNYLSFPGALVVKNLPKDAGDSEAQVQPLVWKIPWSRKWQPSQVFLPRKFHGQRSLESYSPWGSKKSDMTERLSAELY